MHVGKAPAFQFYASDFRSDAHVTAMTLEELGAYILLLTFCWTEGSIPREPKALVRLLKVDAKTWARIWPALAPCFTVQGDTYVQARMERERAKQADYRGLQSGKGAKVASKRWNGDGRGIVRPMAGGMAGDSSSSSSSSSSPSSMPSEGVAIAAAAALPPFVGRHTPVPGYRRLRVFQWMLDDLVEMLGDCAEVFDLDQWLLELDSGGDVLPPRLWPWLKDEVSAEAGRRGMHPKWSGAKPSSGDALLQLLHESGERE